MKKYSVENFSYSDAPQICSVVFFPGCNMKCPYCYNIDIINGDNDGYTQDGLLSYIESKVDTNVHGNKYSSVDYFTFSGGECTLQQSFLKKCLKKVKACGMKTAVYTNLTVLLEDDLLDLIDWLNIDYKFLTKDYSKYMCNSDENIRKIIDENISRILKKESLNFTINTTTLKSIHTLEYLESMKKELSKKFNHELKVILRKKLTYKPFTWTLTPFYNDKDFIPTLVNLKTVEETYKDKQLLDFCKILNNGS